MCIAIDESVQNRRIIIICYKINWKVALVHRSNGWSMELLSNTNPVGTLHVRTQNAYISCCVICWWYQWSCYGFVWPILLFLFLYLLNCIDERKLDCSVNISLFTHSRQSINLHLLSYYMRHGIFTKWKKTEEMMRMRCSRDLRCLTSTPISNDKIDIFYANCQQIMFCSMNNDEKRDTKLIWRTFGAIWTIAAQSNLCLHGIKSQRRTWKIFRQKAFNRVRTTCRKDFKLTICSPRNQFHCFSFEVD